MTPKPELALPWRASANSWQYTTIYDVNGVPVMRFDLEDWGVDEDNQTHLEARQAVVANFVIRAVSSLAAAPIDQPVLTDDIRGEIARRLQERNHFIDMPTMRAIVDEAISAALVSP